MKRIGKPVFFIVAIIILLLTYTSVFGVYGENGDFTITYIKGISDIRWGIDIKGGVEVVFMPADSEDATEEQMQSVKSIIDMRLVSQNITDYELYPDYTNDRITVRFPWKSDEKDYDPDAAIEELAATAKLTFRPGDSYSDVQYADDGSVIYVTPSGETAETILLDGSTIKSAQAQYSVNDDGKYEYCVALEFTDDGEATFLEAANSYKGEVISIWMDDQMISAPTVSSEGFTDTSNITITGDFSSEEATDLAQKINAGALPFDLEVESYGTISPTLGSSALEAMAIAAVIALAFIVIFMIVMYKVPGFVACIALLGQLAISIIAVSGYFPVFPSFTMTLPGIAGIILSIGMGVDANIITAERIKDELYTGKTLDGCIMTGTKSSFSAIFDGNVTIIIVAIILILVFGPANILSSLFGVSTTGLIYAFGYTLLVGVIANFIMGVGASRLMLRSISGLKFLRNRRLYGGKKS